MKSALQVSYYVYLTEMHFAHVVDSVISRFVDVINLSLIHI